MTQFYEYAKSCQHLQKFDDMPGTVKTKLLTLYLRDFVVKHKKIQIFDIYHKDGQSKVIIDAFFSLMKKPGIDIRGAIDFSDTLIPTLMTRFSGEIESKLMSYGWNKGRKCDG